MKTNLFTFASQLGTFWIRPEPAGRVRLGIDRTLLKSYGSATAAARAVAARQTGWPKWDSDVAERAPRTLRNWKRGEPGGLASKKRLDRPGFNHRRAAELAPNE